jgi:hypothetical protein
VPTVVDFSEGETFQILWALSDAIDLAKQVDALSTMAMLDGVFRMVSAPARGTTGELA